MPVRHIQPQRFEDSRGWFTETWNEARFADWGVGSKFVQDNHSFSRLSNTIRGIHFQRPPHAQAKLVRCVKGRIFDVAVDLRHESPTFKHWVAIELSAAKGNQLFIPAGFGHGFLTLEPECEVAYKVDAFYAPEADGGIVWNDPELAISWPALRTPPVLSDKDGLLPPFSQATFDFSYDGTPLLPL
jgi:dTDP-4-dehydrorhamnose 3,5-epimerase